MYCMHFLFSHLVLLVFLRLEIIKSCDFPDKKIEIIIGYEIEKESNLEFLKRNLPIRAKEIILILFCCTTRITLI